MLSLCFGSNTYSGQDLGQTSEIKSEFENICGLKKTSTFHGAVNLQRVPMRRIQMDDKFSVPKTHSPLVLG